MLKKIFGIVIINFLLFFGLGAILYNKRPDVDTKINLFFIGLENKKLFNYLQLKNHKYLNIEIFTANETIERCYKILDEKLEKTDNCVEDIKVIFDEHSISTIINSPHNLRSMLFSEILTGHAKITGLRITDISNAMLKQDWEE
jgi:hypothetical protein